MLGIRSIVHPALLAASFTGAGAAAPVWSASSRHLDVVAAVVLCVVPLAANLGFLANTGSRYRRQNIFWTLWAVACVLWSAGQLFWTVSLLNGNRPQPPPLADLVFFLSLVPMLAALTVRPHRRGLAEALRYGYVDLAMLAAWSLYVYGFFVLAPEVSPGGAVLYQRHYLELTAAANLLLVASLFALRRHALGGWRRIYAHLFGACSLHAVAWLLLRWSVSRGAFSLGMLFDLPLVASFVWFGLAGANASGLTLQPAQTPPKPMDHRWALRLAVAGILTLPLTGLWAMFEQVPAEVRRLRIDLTLVAITAGILLLLIRQRRVDRNRRALLLDTQRSLDKSNRLQAHLVLNEKLASLGELSAGAAREIGDPLTAIFGYTELLLAESGASDRVRSAARKIQTQAHRTRALVDNLLRFARQVSPEKTPLDLNGLLSSAVQLHRFHLSDRSIAVNLDLCPGLPAVRGDPKLLLQVFYEIIDNAADAMSPAGGGHLTIHTQLECATVSVEFADTGPGIDQPERVFDPFYTTKDVGKGTGLGLSMCYGIVKEHGGQIGCCNVPGSGAIFRLEFPAVVLPLQLKRLLETADRIP